MKCYFVCMNLVSVEAFRIVQTFILVRIIVKISPKDTILIFLKTMGFLKTRLNEEVYF